MASHLGATARQRAVDFIQANGTNLHRELFQFHFHGGSADNVLAALSHYRNADGGFGHGLEADLRTKHSSVVATTVALQIIDELEAFDCALAKDAVHYLADSYADENWPLINERCNDAPHAPWWTWDPAPPAPGRFLANPGVEVLSYLITWCAMGKSTREQVWGRTLTHITNNQLEMHELLCYLRLYDNPRLPDAARRALLPHLLTQSFQLVRVDPRDWDEYALMPISVVHHPASPLMDFFGDALDANFEYQIERQNADGSWSPAWSWGNAYPEAWRQAEVEIKSMLTLRFLLQLQRFGRLGDEGRAG